MQCTNSKSPSFSASLNFLDWNLEFGRNDLWLIFAVILCGLRSQRLRRKEGSEHFIRGDIVNKLDVLDEAQ